MPKSNYEATMAEAKRIGESGKTPIRNLGIDCPTAKKDIGCHPGQGASQLVGIQRDATTKGSPRRSTTGLC